ncbi:MAG: hypothetical protein U0N23_05235, partial [Parasutterella excrementihominis]
IGTGGGVRGCSLEFSETLLNFLLVRSISRRKGRSVTGVNSIDLKESQAPLRYKKSIFGPS